MEVRIRAPKLLANLSNKSINTKNADPRMYQFLPECTELPNYTFKANNKDTTTTPMASFWYLCC